MIGDGSGLTTVRFWGVRGSVPSPLSPTDVETKVLHASAIMLDARHDGPREIPFEIRSTYGGNTTCVEVRCDGALFILDLGTGVRSLGDALLRASGRGGLDAVVLQSHLHFDHLQGFPFFAPIYRTSPSRNVRLTVCGGVDEGLTPLQALSTLMRPPFFPKSLRALTAGHHLELEDAHVHDGWRRTFYGTHKPVEVLARSLHHPQETFGYRLTCNGRRVAFTTDHEPYAGSAIPAGLRELVDGADLWITDCQYSLHTYEGGRGIPRHGWGHSFPEYIAAVAREAGPKRICTMHHDYDADDREIASIARSVADLSGIRADAAFEGMHIVL